jgi:hypothetical protein
METEFLFANMLENIHFGECELKRIVGRSGMEMRDMWNRIRMICSGDYLYWGPKLRVLLPLVS